MLQLGKLQGAELKIVELKFALSGQGLNHIKVVMHDVKDEKGNKNVAQRVCFSLPVLLVS